jgi:hypothetical protein
LVWSKEQRLELEREREKEGERDVRRNGYCICGVTEEGDVLPCGHSHR